MSEIDDLFKTLRKVAKEKCECGNKNYIAPVFHADNCTYRYIAEKMFEEFHSKGEPENGRAEKTTIEEKPLKTGSKQCDLFPTGS